MDIVILIVRIEKDELIGTRSEKQKGTEPEFTPGPNSNNEALKKLNRCSDEGPMPLPLSLSFYMFLACTLSNIYSL